MKVLGARADLGRILSAERPDEVVLAMPQATPNVLREIMSALGTFKVSVKILPSMHDLLSDRSVVSQIRSVAVEDLLARAPVHMNTEVMVAMVAGRRVLITGAGGSIGSELSRQISAMRPEAVVLYERHENSLYTIAKELDDRGVLTLIHPVLGDVTDRRRLAETMTRYRPAIVFHAAAHKHVPLVELNPSEALEEQLYRNTNHGRNSRPLRSRAICSHFDRQGRESIERDGRDQACRRARGPGYGGAERNSLSHRPIRKRLGQQRQCALTVSRTNSIRWTCDRHASGDPAILHAHT